MSATDPQPATPYVDRRGWLVFFGIVLIVFGFFAALAALLMTFMLLMPQPAGAPRMTVGTFAGAILLYLALAALFLTLGIGSIMARRWARALTLAAAWVWLISGILAGVAFVGMSRMMFAVVPDDGTRGFVMGCVGVVLGLFGVVVPLVLILFYRGANVRATVEALDPVRRWTDRVPLPVLLFAIWMFFGAAGMLMCCFYPSVPVGKWILTGIAVPAVYLSLATVLFFIGAGALQLRRGAWWAAVAAVVAGAVFLAFVFPQTDLAAWSQSLGPSTPEQSRMLQQMYKGPTFWIMMGASWAVYVGFLVYIRRYFFPSQTA